MPETPLPGQERCGDCNRLAAPDWTYCPSCGAPLVAQVSGHQDAKGSMLDE